MLLAVGLGWAVDPSSAWKALYEARFVQIADGAPENAGQLYASLLADGSEGESASTYYWMGQARLSTGDLEGASEVLKLALADPRYREETLALLEEANLRLRSIAGVPARFDFEADTFPGVRSGAGAGRGQAGVQQVDGRGVYAWTTTIRPGEPDGVALRFRSGTEVTGVRWVARSRGAPAVLQVVAVDRWGAAWTSTEVVVDDDDWYDVHLRIADFVAVDGASSPLRIGRVVELRLEDVTGERSDVRGPHTILLDDFVVE